MSSQQKPYTVIQIHSVPGHFWVTPTVNTVPDQLPTWGFVQVPYKASLPQEHLSLQLTFLHSLESCNSVCPSVCLSVYPSVTRVLCDKTKQCTADIWIPHKRAITIVFWHQQWLAGDAPFHLKFALKLTQPLRKTPTSTDFRLYAIAKKVQLWRIRKSTTGFKTSY